MTTEIENALNLPRLQEVLNQLKVNEEQKLLAEQEAKHQMPETAEAFTKILENNDKIEKALDIDRAFTEHDQEMNEIKDTALKTHRDMIDLAFNIDPKNAGEIMSAGVQMLKVALDASNSKVERRLKTIKLQLDKRRLDQSEPAKEGIIQSEGNLLIDRNEVLKRLDELKKGE
jgi:hypothetical protein